jgi:transcriptional regulator with XRE-family HTH domain
MNGPARHAGREQLGERISRLRRSVGLSQEELGRRAGVKAVQISKYERGIYAPRAAVLGRIAAALGTTADYLLAGQMPAAKDGLTAVLPRLDALPAELRAHLFELLDAVLRAHDLTRPEQRAAEAP